MAMITCTIGFLVCTFALGLSIGAFIALIMSERAYDKGKTDGLRLADEIIDEFIKRQEEKDGTEENE